MEKFAVILVAAGKSQRFQKGSGSFGDSLSRKKPFHLLKGRAVWLYSAQRFANRKDVRQILLVVAPEDREAVEHRFSADLSLMGIELVDGGPERFDSVKNALDRVNDSNDFIAIHDAARPCLTDSALDSVLQAAIHTGAALLAAPIHSTIKQVRSVAREHRSDLEQLQARLASENSSSKKILSVPLVERTLDRQALWEAQTPQVFRSDLIKRAYQERKNIRPTDDAQLVEELGESVEIVPSSALNIKLTTPEDLLIAEKFLEIVNRSTSRDFFNQAFGPR